MIPIFQFLHSPSFHNNTTRGKQRKIKILISNLKILPILGIKEKHIFFFPIGQLGWCNVAVIVR